MEESSHEPGIASEEVVASLFRGQFADGREDPKGVACEHDDVGGLLWDVTGDTGVGDVLDRVRASSVLRDAHIVVVWKAVDRVVDDVLEDGAKADGGVDLGFLLRGEVDTFGVASTFDVEHTIVGPDVLVITDQLPMGISGEGPVGLDMSEGVQTEVNIPVRLASSRKAEEEGHVFVLGAVVGR